MSKQDTRHRLISTLLQADGPLNLKELLAASGLTARAARAALKELLSEGRVVGGRFAPGRGGPQYRWAARWHEESRDAAEQWRRKLTETVGSPEELAGGRLDIESPPIAAFHDYVVGEYAPPTDKRFCVFFQCSVRRPFSKSPSHASMRRAVAAATGFDPALDFEACPVHVVVLASTIGPVPYELEDVYPANVRGGGVKHFRPDHYARVRPILAGRMADYLAAHGRRYEHVTTFTEGRYAEVMHDARRIAGAGFPILPDPAGRRVLRMGASKPRKYWEKFWIQLYDEIAGWLDDPARARAEQRLKTLKVTCG